MAVMGAGFFSTPAQEMIDENLSEEFAIKFYFAVVGWLVRLLRSPFNCSSVKKITFTVGANSYFECGREIALYAVVTRHCEKALVIRHWRNDNGNRTADPV
jgi:hypothetical protein